MGRNPIANNFRLIFSALSVGVGIMMMLFAILWFIMSLVAVFEPLPLKGLWRLLFILFMTFGTFFISLPIYVNKFAQMMDPTEPSNRRDEESKDVPSEMDEETQPRPSDELIEEERV